MAKAAGVGHNSGETLMGAAQDSLRNFLKAIEDVTDDDLNPAKERIKELYAAAKAAGFDPKPLRKIVALRSKDKTKLAEEKAILELYAHALGVEDLV